MVERKFVWRLRFGGRLGALVLTAAIAFVTNAAAEAENVVPLAANPESERLKELSLDHWIARSNRLQRIAQRVQIAGAEICEPTISPILGAAILDVKEIYKSLKPTAQERFGKKYRFYVTEVFEAMASERAGLKVGDAILKLNGAELKAESQFYGFKRSESKPNRLEVQRGDEVVELSVETVYGCRYPAELTSQELVNAFATGKSTQFTTALLRYFADDDSIAIIVGHELGHNIFWSPGSARYGDWVSRQNEARADYVGLYLSAIAGYPFVDGIFRKLGRFTSVGGYSDKTAHPSNPERAVAQRKTIEEIEGKLQRGEPLEPRFE